MANSSDVNPSKHPISTKCSSLCFSGKKSSKTGEVYAPKAQIDRLKSTSKGRSKLAAANRKKRQATAKGKQHARHGLHKGKKR